jgi:hypothetical protein
MTSIGSNHSIEYPDDTPSEWHSEQLDDPQPPNPYDTDTKKETKETICVNSANLPIGNKARDRFGNPVGIAGKGFRPVIIDIPKKGIRRDRSESLHQSMAKLRVYDY